MTTNQQPTTDNLLQASRTQAPPATSTQIRQLRLVFSRLPEPALPLMLEVELHLPSPPSPPPNLDITLEEALRVRTIPLLVKILAGVEALLILTPADTEWGSPLPHANDESEGLVVNVFSSPRRIR